MTSSAPDVAFRARGNLCAAARLILRSHPSVPPPLRINLGLFVPKSIVCIREGISREQLFRDLFAGVVVGVVALPLALAFAIASGVPPERGLYTAIVAGFLISALGGSRVQIGGPTGAFVVLIASIIATYGIGNLVICTIMAGLILVVMGFARVGNVIKYIPYPVTTGFTTGIAVLIASTQVKDFFRLQLPAMPASSSGRLARPATSTGGR